MTDSLEQMEFPDTPWSLLARQQADIGAENLALQGLLELYWQPVFCAIRDGWHIDPEEAGVLCDNFLLELLSGDDIASSGRSDKFRVYLKTQLERFMESNPSRTPSKRGSGIAIDTSIAAERSDASAEGVFDERWMLVVFRQALKQTQEKLHQNAAAYELLVDIDIGKLDMTLSADQVAGLRLARTCFRRELLDLVCQYVSSFDEARDELRWLLS